MQGPMLSEITNNFTLKRDFNKTFQRLRTVADSFCFVFDSIRRIFCFFETAQKKSLSNDFNSITLTVENQQSVVDIGIERAEMKLALCA